MKVNCLKTQLLMISPPNGYEKKAFVSIGNQKIESTNTMKLLGFVFGREPTVAAHVEEIQRKFRSRFWSLIFLKRAGISGNELFKIFNVFLRPIIEYCCIVYHPLLTTTQSNIIEKMQKQVVKLAFGWDRDYYVVCAEQDIQTLKKRRENYIDNFVMKAVRSSRFKEAWFPLREPDIYNLRGRRPFIETKAKTKRYYCSPLSFMRRRANDIHSETQTNNEGYDSY